MTEKLIPYRVNGEMFDVPESSREKFEKRYPDATIEMHVGDEIFDVPFAQESAFLNRYPNAVYGFNESSATSSEDVPAPVSVDNEPEMTRRERRQARRERFNDWAIKANDSLSRAEIGADRGASDLMMDKATDADHTGFFESLGKGLGAGVVGATKDFTDLVNVLNTGTGTTGAAIISQGKFDEALLAEDNPLYKTSANLGDTQEKLSREADPTAGESSFWDLIKEGKLGTAMQKAVASGAESLPMMFFSRTIPGSLLYGSAMAASNYIDETQENPDIPSWKRAINAAGTAALELAIERLGGPLKAKGKLTKEAITKFLNDVAKEGTETIAKRIFKGIGGVVKEGWEEGWEEVGTSFGNDILGTALDAIDGDADYGIKAQWEQLKDEDPNADAWDFAKMKGAEYMDSYIGGALSGMEISGAVKGINKGVSLMRGETRTAVQAARENGAALDYADMYDVDALVSESATALEGTLVDKDGNSIVDRAFIDNISADEAYALAGRDDLSGEQRQAFFNYAQAKAASEGLNEKLDNRLNEQIEGVRGRIDEAKDENGRVIVGTVDGKAVYVKGGYVTEKGTVATGIGDVDGYSYGPVIVIDSVTGEKTTVSSDKIQSPSAHEAYELFSGMESVFREREANERDTARNTVSPRAKLNTVMGLQNRKLLVDLGDGLIEVEVMRVDPKTGEVMIRGKKGDLGGHAITKLGSDVFYDSLYRDEDGEFAFVDDADIPAEDGTESETPAEVTEIPDYRDQSFTILYNGVPVSAEVIYQDDASDNVVYRIIGDDGKPMLLSSTIGEFGSAIEAAATAPVAPVTPVTPVTPAETEPETPAEDGTETEAPAAPIEPETIDWDALFESDPEAYFTELQKQFGEEALDILNEEIEAAQNELDALAKAKTKNQNERLENRNKKKALQNRIDTLNGMVARLAPPAAPETAPEPEQPVTATETEVPVAETPTEPVEPETPAVVEPTPEPETEQEVTPEPEEEPAPTEEPEAIPEAPATNIPFQIPEQQKGNAIGRLVAEIRQKIDKLVAKAGAKDFISTDTSRPAMTGIYHSGGFEYATDSHILVKIKANYPAEQEGKITSPKTGQEITGNFPNADKVIKGAYEDARPVTANLDDIIAYAQAAEEIKKGLKKGTKINIGVGEKVFDSAKLLIAAKMAKKHGLTSILTKDKHYSAMMFSGKDGEILIMPVTNPSSGIIQISDGRSVFGMTQSYSIKTPETLKGIEATRTALEAILPNLEEEEIYRLKNQGVVKLDNGKVIYVFATADIAKNKEKAKDPNTYNALDEIEKHGLEIPLSKDEIAILFPESVNTPGNSVPLENEPNGEDNGGKEDAPEGDGSVRPEDGNTGGGAGNGGSQTGDKGNTEAVPPQGTSSSEGGKESGKVKHQYPARKGNVTRKTLIDTFGLAAVEIPDSRKQFLNTFYDFMMEMSKTLGISPKSIGNGGWLTLGNLRSNAGAFARHSLTYGTFTGDVLEQHLLLKYSRVSSIAHEWWHSLDHALGFFESGKTKGPTTGMVPSAFDGRQETIDAVLAVMQAIRDSGYTSRIQSLNYTQSFKDYVLEPTESAARAFAEYIRNRFDEHGITIAGVNEFYDDTQPTAEEMKFITPAIENLFNVLQEKEGLRPGTSILYQIGEDVDSKIASSSETSEVARKLANEAIDMMFEQAGREVVFVTDEQAEQMRKLAGADAEFMISSDKPVFVSNAAVAVMGIKQEKATPAQWLAMIEKAGGLKAGEDKWMGLSDWLKASDKKTLTKQEVLDYITENTIQIEEVHYAQDTKVRAEIADAELQMLEKFQPEFDKYVAESEEATGSIFMADHYQYAYNKMLDIYGDDFGLAFGHEDGMLEINDTDAASAVSGVPIPDIREIDPTREYYTTEGLTKKREIAIVVPSIESWETEDEIHFGDAGEGRAVAWVRFGETYINEEADAAYEQAKREEEEFRSQMEQKYGSLANGMRSTLTEEEYSHYMSLVNRTLQLNESRKTAKEKKVLVIDEIQSKRHQEGREKGYTTKEDVAQRKAAIARAKKATNDLYDYIGELVAKYPGTEYSLERVRENRGRFTEEENNKLTLLIMEHNYAELELEKHRGEGVPDAPFEKNWYELAMKRMLRYAAEHGYDAIAWTKGEQQAERYGIAKVVKDIFVAPSDVERYVSIKTISGDAIEVPTEPNSDVIVSGDYKGQRLSDVVGKELADKILSVPEGTDDYISGDDLKVGGEGMKGFYDKMLPAFMNKYGKKWGIKVADITLPNVEEAGRVMHSVPVTDAMKESVMEGQVMFMKRPNGKVFGWTDGKKIYLTKDGLNPNTKIHEYTHLWAQAMMQKNPNGWQSVKDLLRGTPVWNEVLNDPNYSNIHADEDLVASEVLSRISGRDGSAKLERMAQQMVDEAKGSMRKLEARGLIQRIKDALNEFWNWVGTELFGIEKFESVEQVTDRVLWDLMNATDLGELSEGQVETQIVTDPKVIAELEASPKRTGYRNVVMNEDGTFSSPMAYWLQSTKGGAKTRVETAKFELGKWEEAEEHPELVDENGHVTLVKPNKSTVEVAYDPYIHNRLDPVNLQFKDAWKREELVYVETVVPETDLESGYHAEGALLPVGVHSWSNGDLILSKYDKPVRIMPWEAVADAWVERLNGEGVHFDVVPPALRPLLVERGVEILPPHKGMGKDCFDAYDTWKKESEKSEFTSSEIAAMETPILSSKGTFKNLSEAEEWAKANLQGKSYVNRFTNDTITISGKSIKEMLNPNTTKKISESVHMAALMSVPDFIETGIPAEQHADTHGRGFDVIRLYNAIEIDGKVYRVKSTVKRLKEGDRYYTYEIQEMELIEDTQSTAVGLNGNPVLNSTNSITGAKLLKKVRKTNSSEFILEEDNLSDDGLLFRSSESPITPQMDAEYLAAVERGDMETAQRMVLEAAKLAMPNTKVVDENGNPKVVYHGTGSEFYTFRKTKESNELGTGYYFSDSYEMAERYATDETLADNRFRAEDLAFEIFTEEMGHSEEEYEYENEETEDDYNEAYYQAVQRLFGNGHVKSVFLNIENPFIIGNRSEDFPVTSLWEQTSEAHRANDGIIDPEFTRRHETLSGNQYVAFKPSQIKSADPVTYDDAGNVIPLSERFNPEKDDIRYRKTEAQNAAVDYLAGEPRLRAIENAVNEEAATLGVKVTYKTREQMPNGHQNDKGYYDPKTGEVVVCTENATSVADAIQTILHEAVAHKGLRQLMGDKFNEFISRVYESLDAETKAKVDALAESQYNGNKAVAMEEYMATLAESTDFKKDTLWDKIKSIFEDIINAILGRNDIRIGDNELRYILRASYNNMVNPRGMETMRGWAQDQMMREEYGIGMTSDEIAKLDAEYMKAVEEGDMETAQRLVLEAAKRAMPNTKVVDKNGAPKVVYHGSPNVFYKFGSDSSVKRAHTAEDTHFFVDDMEVAQSYGKELYPVFLNLANPIVKDFEGNSWNQYAGPITPEELKEWEEERKARKERIKDLQEKIEMLKTDYEASIDENDIFGIGDPVIMQEIHELESELNMATLLDRTLSTPPTHTYSTTDKLVADARDTSDGAIFKNVTDAASPELTHKVVTDYVAYDPSQVKSAAPVTYDDNGNVIPLSQRFNLSNDDIRFRTGVDPSTTAREAAKAVYDKVVNDTWQEIQRQFQDAYQPVRIAIDAIQQETGNIPIEDYENYLLIQNQSSSRSRVEIDEFAERYYSPIVEQVNKIIDTIMESRGLDINDENRRAEVYAELRQYLIAKHGLERNEYYQTHKMRNLTAAEKRPEYARAKHAYDTEVADINADTSLTDAERELKLRDAKDAYDAAILEINTREVPDIRDYSGLTSLFGFEPKDFRKAEAEAQRVVNDFEARFGAETDILWDRIKKATDKTLRHSYESGIISRQQYNDIKDMFEFYIPLRGFDEITAEDIYSYARFEGNRFSAAVQTAHGRTSVANDPLAYIMSMAESEITQGNKNRAKQALYNYLLNRTQTDADGNQIQNSLMQVESVWYVKSVDATGSTVMTLAAPDHASGETYEEFEIRMEALAATGNAVKSRRGSVDVGMRFQKPANMSAHYVYLKVNGVEKAIYINGDPKAAEAINGTYKKQRDELGEKVGKWNRFLSSMFTNYSLEFTVRNYFRDMLYSLINIGIKESDPAYRKKFRQNWRHNNLGSMVRMLKAFRAGEFEGRALTADEAAFVEFMKNGGQTGYVILNKIENHRLDLEKAIERMQNGIVKGGVKDSTVFKYTLGAVELLNEASELVTRFAAFKTSRDMGRSVVQSISDAKEVTVNFNTKGAQDGKGWIGIAARYFGLSKYFFNASIQGVQNLKAMANANKLKFGGVVGGIVATGFLMPIITGAIAQLLGGDEEEYWNIPEYDRQNNFCIPVGNGKYAKIPLPVGFREMYAIGDMVSAMMFDKKFAKDVKSVGTDIANKIASIVLPINPLEGTANGLSIWHTLAYTAAPSSAQFLIQNLTNTDWKGAPLQKEYTYNENDPQWMKAFAGNPDWMKLLSKWCNEHINADGDYNGWDWSPEKLDNTLSNLFGGVYTLIKKTGKSISMIWNEENRNMQNAPVAGVFLGSGIDNDDRFVTDAYYEMMDYYDSQVGYIKRRAERFGYDLDEVFNKEKGKHHPKMNEIYSNKNFDFMQEWYKGNNKLEKLNDKIKNLEKKIAIKENPTQSDLNKLARLKEQFAIERREFVDDMLELD